MPDRLIATQKAQIMADLEDIASAAATIGEATISALEIARTLPPNSRQER